MQRGKGIDFPSSWGDIATPLTLPVLNTVGFKRNLHGLQSDLSKGCLNGEKKALDTAWCISLWISQV